MMKEGEVRRFTSSNVDAVPSGIGGVYAIYHPAASLVHIYLGQTKDLKRRLKEHLRASANDRNNKTVKTLLRNNEELWFSYGKSGNYKGAEAAELKRYMPVANKKMERKFLEDLS